MSEKFLLKDHLFNKERVMYLARRIKKAYPKFQEKKFINFCTSKFPELELKERIHHIAHSIEKFLPRDFETALEIILTALPPELDPQKTDDDFGEFILSPFTTFVVNKGLSKKYLKRSLEALGEFTKRFSAEDGIRFFINAFPKESLIQIKKWSRSKNYHQRRLASEGTRPTLPWNIKIDFDYIKGIEILDDLFSDPTRYVTRSVANHMNDISKIDAELVLKTLKKWAKTNKQNDEEMKYIIRHSLRTLVKRGNRNALKLLGYLEPKISAPQITINTPQVTIGKALEFSACFESLAQQSLLIDYVLYFQNKAGKLQPKVFKIKKCATHKNESICFNKIHPLRIMTTKKLYPGEHAIALQINGELFSKHHFTLVEPS